MAYIYTWLSFSVTFAVSRNQCPGQHQHGLIAPGYRTGLKYYKSLKYNIWYLVCHILQTNSNKAIIYIYVCVSLWSTLHKMKRVGDPDLSYIKEEIRMVEGRVLGVCVVLASAAQLSLSRFLFVPHFSRTGCTYSNHDSLFALQMVPRRGSRRPSTCPICWVMQVLLIQ